MNGNLRFTDVSFLFSLSLQPAIKAAEIRIKEGRRKNLACFVITIPQKPKARYLPKRQCVNSQKEKYSSLSYKLSFVDVRNSYEYWQLKAHKHKKD